MSGRAQQSYYSQFTDSSQVPTHRDNDTVKLMIVGDDGVGKTCFILKWSDDGFNRSHIPTVGVDFKDRAIRLGKKDIVVEIWDTAGSEAFDTVTTPIYDRMEGIIVMFDIANINTFKNLDRWFHKIKEKTKSVPLVLVGNKSDTDEVNRAVKRSKCQVYAKEKGLRLYETSAFFGSKIDDVVNDLVNQVLSRRKELIIVKKNLRKQEKKSGEKSMTVGDEKQSRSRRSRSLFAGRASRSRPPSSSRTRGRSRGSVTSRGVGRSSMQSLASFSRKSRTVKGGRSRKKCVIL